MALNNIKLRTLTHSVAQTKGAELTWTEMDTNLIQLINEINGLQIASGSNLEVFNATTTYSNVAPSYVSYGGNLWEYIHATPQAGIVPGTDALVWSQTSVGALVHAQNTDSWVGLGTLYPSSSQQIHAVINNSIFTTTRALVMDPTIGLIAQASLKPGRWYYISDKDIYLQAISTTGFANDGYLKETYPSGAGRRSGTFYERVRYNILTDIRMFRVDSEGNEAHSEVAIGNMSWGYAGYRNNKVLSGYIYATAPGSSSAVENEINGVVHLIGASSLNNTKVRGAIIVFEDTSSGDSLEVNNGTSVTVRNGTTLSNIVFSSGQAIEFGENLYIVGGSVIAGYSSLPYVMDMDSQISHGVLNVPSTEVNWLGEIHIMSTGTTSESVVSLVNIPQAHPVRIRPQADISLQVNSGGNISYPGGSLPFTLDGSSGDYMEVEYNAKTATYLITKLILT